MNLDLLAAICCGLMAGCLFALHAISSPKRHNWFTMPEYVRKGLLLTGATLTWRSVNLLTLPQPPAERGHVNAEGMLVTLALTYLIVALTVWAARRYLPGKGWLRLHWAERVERDHPELALAPVTSEEMEHLARAKGLHVNAKPPETHQ
jgi:MFS superfamily sulfate permease-like transporter